MVLSTLLLPGQVHRIILSCELLEGERTGEYKPVHTDHLQILLSADSRAGPSLCMFSHLLCGAHVAGSGFK